MNVVIVNCFDTYETRAEMVYNYFENNGDKVTVVASDFCHIHKTYRKDKKEDHVFVHVKEYRKNLSFARMKSHYLFAKNAFDEVEKLYPDLLYVFIPANSLVKEAAIYKKKYKNVKLIFDVIDLWPETMTMGKIKNMFPFTYWRNLRDKHIVNADYVITECDLFRDKLIEKVDNEKISTLYFAAKELPPEIRICEVPSDESMSLGYLGSINNIIDIDTISEIIESIKKPVELHIIGDGEKRDELIERAEKAGARVYYYGKVYDDNEKFKILSMCHFGLNIMKDTVCVGLTMKSVEYFRYSIPIINNIDGDTWKLVQCENLGINFRSKNNLLEKLESFDYLVSKEKIKLFFRENLSETRFNEQIKDIVEKVLLADTKI